METFLKLAQARIEKGLTQAAVAEYVNVSIATICRWEKGTMQPYPRHLHKLCDLFGMTAFELGLVHIETEAVTPAPLPVETRLKDDHAFTKWFRRDLELRLNCIMYDWLHSKKLSGSYAMLQYRLSQELKDDDAMTNEPTKQDDEGVNGARREALRRLALVPIYALGLGAIGTAPSWAPEDILTHCAAGVTACEHLANGQYDDMTLASSVLTTYLTPLKEIVERSSMHRKEAARLVAQVLLIKMLLAVHREGPKRAISYGKQAVIYSKECTDLSLQPMILRRLAWVYSCDKQIARAAQTILQAQSLLEDDLTHIPFPIQSTIYGSVAKHQARNGQTENALLGLRRSHETFSTSTTQNNNSSYTDHDLPHLLLVDGQTHYFMGEYEQALTTLKQIIDLETLNPKMLVSSERIRVEIINNQTLASLKSPKKNKELSVHLWTAGIQGAIALQSEQRFNEALTAYDIMEALWPDDSHIKELRDLTRHW